MTEGEKINGIKLGEGENAGDATGRRLGGNEGVGGRRVVGDTNIGEVLGIPEVSVSTSLTGACPATPHRTPTKASSFRFKVVILMMSQGDEEKFRRVSDSLPC